MHKLIKPKTKTFIPSGQKDEQNPVEFRIRPLTRDDRNERINYMFNIKVNVGDLQSDSSSEFKLATVKAWTVKRMICGWSNLTIEADDGSDRPLNFDKQLVPEVWNMLPDEWCEELEEAFGEGEL